jgi:hypothetical protein
MKELKMGDIVEVKAYNWKLWESRIFIKNGLNGGVICVNEMSKDNFDEGKDFITTLWKKEEWRIPEEKSYRSFTWEERERLRGIGIKRKDGTHEATIIEFSIFNGVPFVHTSLRQIAFRQLLEDYTTLNGDVLGVEEK